jgi:ATP-binding cassette subfamily F protein 3
VRPFDGDLDAYRRHLLDRDDEQGPAPAPSASGGRRAERREAAERRLALEPLRRKARLAEAEAARLVSERQALDRELAAPGAFGGRGAALQEALKRRAELARRIEAAEAEWLAAESAIEEMAQA